MTSHWEAYFKELIGAETLSYDEGFVCFTDIGETLFIEHLYFIPSQRKTGAPHLMFEKLKKIAQARGKKLITASLDQERVLNWQQSLKAQLNAGFKLSAVSGGVIYTYLSITDDGIKGEA